MLGTALTAEQEHLIISIPEVKEFRDKMLTKDIVQEIVSKYFEGSSL